MIIWGTGHREEKIPNVSNLRLVLQEQFTSIAPDAFVCGMANGFDLVAGNVALDHGIAVVAAKPWTTHGPRKSDREAYARVIDLAEEVYVVTEADHYPGPWAYQKRNEWMVDSADRGLAFWDGSSGGTYNCIKYAERVKKPIRNIYGQVVSK